MTKMRRIVWIRAGRMPIEVTVASPLTLRHLQCFVDGLIERVPHWACHGSGADIFRCNVYCNEEGRLLNATYNKAATNMWRKRLNALGEPYDTERASLYGDVLIVEELPGDDDEDDDEDEDE